MIEKCWILNRRSVALGQVEVVGDARERQVAGLGHVDEDQQHERLVGGGLAGWAGAAAEFLVPAGQRARN